MRLALSILLGCVALTSGAQGGGTEWRKYANGRFGFVLSYPSGLIASREAMNGDGREFHTADREFSVSANAHFFIHDSDDTFEKRWQEELDTPDVTINYKRKMDNWYAVSGVTKGGTEYYHKLYRQGSNWATFHITFPHAKAKQYEPWVVRIEKSFIPFREGDFDGLD